MSVIPGESFADGEREIGLEYWPGCGRGARPNPWMSGIAALGGSRLIFTAHGRSQAYVLDTGSGAVATLALDLRGPRGSHSLQGGGACICEPGAGRITIVDGYGELRRRIVLESHAPWAACPWEDGFIFVDAGQGGVFYLPGQGTVRQLPLAIRLHRPRAITSAGEGCFVVADSEAQIVVRFSACDGTVQMQLGCYCYPDNTPSTFVGPEHIALTGDGELVVCDTRKNRILWFDPGGTLLRTHGGVDRVGSAPGHLWSPVAAAQGGDGALYVADAANGRVVRLATSARPEATVWGQPSVKRAVFHHPRCFEISGERRLIADSYRNRIVEIGDGRMVAQVSGHDGLDFFWPRFATEVGGRRFYCDSRNGRLLSAVAGAPLEQIRLHNRGKPVELVDPHTVRGGPDGSFITADSKTNSVYAFDADGQVRATWGARRSDCEVRAEVELDDLHDGFMTADGCLWLVDTGHDRLVRLGADGKLLGVVATLWDRAGRNWGSLCAPRAIDILPDGNLVICDSGNHRIVLCTGRGEVLGSYGGHRGHADGHLSDPRFVRYHAGNILITDYLNDRIVVVPVANLLFCSPGGPMNATARNSGVA